MAHEFVVAQRNIRRYRAMLSGLLDAKVRAMYEALLLAEEEALARAGLAQAEMLQRIIRYRNKADELHAIADQAEADPASGRLRIAADNYESLANMLERLLSEDQDPAAGTGG